MAVNSTSSTVATAKEPCASLIDQSSQNDHAFVKQRPSP
jgi:hypothetical protein